MDVSVELSISSNPLKPSVLNKFENAASVGANTVNGPSPCKALTKLVRERASTKVEKSGLADAISTIELEGSSTMGSLSPQEVKPRRITNDGKTEIIHFYLSIILFLHEFLFN